MKKRTKEEQRAYQAQYREKQKDVTPDVTPNENVTPELVTPIESVTPNVTPKLRSKPTGKYELEPLDSPPPKGVAKEQWEAAALRAEVARRYAQPERYQFIRPAEEVFQTIAWQLDELDRYPAPDAPSRA